MSASSRERAWIEVTHNPAAVVSDLAQHYDDQIKLEQFISASKINVEHLAVRGYLPNEDYTLLDVVIAWSKYQRHRAMSSAIELKELRGRK